MKIVADKNVPFLEGVLEPYAEVVYMGGADISKEVLMDADAMIIRTRTKCNAELLEGTKVGMIATATIGTDHIDLDYCREKGMQRDAMQGESCSMCSRLCMVLQPENQLSWMI